MTKRILKGGANLEFRKMKVKILIAFLSFMAEVGCTQKFQLKRTDANIWTVQNVNGRSIYNPKQKSTVTSLRPKTRQEKNFLDGLRGARFDSYEPSVSEIQT